MDKRLNNLGKKSKKVMENIKDEVTETGEKLKKKIDKRMK